MERLTAADLSMVWPEDFGWPQDIGALATLDGKGLLDERGRVAIEEIRRHVERRLHLVPRLRQVLYMPRWGLGWPMWVDAPTIDLEEHVRVLPLDRPGDERQLLSACADLFVRRLDRSRPLWQLWLIPGLPERRIGLFMKLHHAIADGVAGVATLGALLDLARDAPDPNPPPWSPAPIPSSDVLFADNLRGRVQGVERLGSRLAHPVETAEQLRRAWPAIRETFVEGSAPRTSLNRPIGSGRSLTVIRCRLDLMKEVAHRNDGKVNDVMLAVVAGGLRDLLRNRREDIDQLVLRAFVPVSLHREGSGEARGNLDGAMVVPLPIGEADPFRRLRLIAAETAKRRKLSRPAGGTLFRSVLLQKAFMRYVAHQRIFNVYVANVPGPPIPLYLAGAKILEVFPLVPIMGNMTLGVGALSYAGQFNITAVADRDRCPDVRVFVEGLRSAIDQLGHRVLASA